MLPVRRKLILPQQPPLTFTITGIIAIIATAVAVTFATSRATVTPTKTLVMAAATSVYIHTIKGITTAATRTSTNCLTTNYKKSKGAFPTAGTVTATFISAATTYFTVTSITTDAPTHAIQMELLLQLLSLKLLLLPQIYLQLLQQ